MKYLLLASVASFGGFAEPLENDDIDEVVVVSANRYQTPLTELPGSAQQLDADSLAALNPQHIQQALVQVAGATFARGDGVEYLPGLRSPVQTGPGACGSVLSAVDGIPLRAAGFCNINELFEAPIELGASIEVLSGPWSTIYGSNALTGVVNVLTPDFAERGSQLSVTLSDNAYHQLTGLYDGQAGEHDIIAAASISHDDGYRDSSGYNQQKLLLKHGITLDSFRVISTLNVSRLDQQTAAYLVGKDSYKDKELSKTNPAPEAYRKAHAIRFSSRIDGGNDDLRWQITPYARHVDMEFLQHFLPGTPVEENRHTSVGVQTSWLWHWLEAGVDLEYTQGSLLQFQEKPTQGSDFLEATIPVGKHYDYKVDATLVSPFAQVTVPLTEQLTMTLAARVDYQHYDYQNQMNSGRVDEQGMPCGFGGCRYNRPESSRDSFSAFSPKAGLIYQLTPNHQLFSNVSRGHRAPQATELYRLQRAQNKTDLSNETLDSIELGWRGNHNAWRWQAATYWMKRDNLILRDSDFFTVTGGTTNHKGIEAKLVAQLSNHWQWQFNGSYAIHRYGDVPQLGDVKGNRVDSAPAFNGSSQLRWQLTEALNATAEWLYVDEYYTDAANMHQYDGHQLVNLRGQWQMTEAFIISAKVDNLLDTRYAERADYSNFSGDRYFPGRGRTAYLEFNYRMPM
ncbi:TonB-dependent receptor [Paraferrimonas haliotis]|uniref:TonB-dependent receptor n=1 Tax=Paraferrimonas haliotis TaxID=2013866 RepID=UPI000BA91DD4|nr:TonB-dependent receptor [Paraferrimonas haliotis]